MKPTFVVSLAAAMIAAAGAQAATYHLTDIGTFAGESQIVPNAINAKGHVTGSTESHAFLYDGGALRDLRTLPGGALSAGYAIDSHDFVAGSSQFRNGGAIVHATLFRGRRRIDLGVLEEAGNISVATGINDRGEIVGYGAPNPGSTNTRAFIWDDKNGMRDIGTLGGQYSRALSINRVGEVTGASQVPTGFGNFHAFLWDQANGMRDLGTIGGDVSSGVFLNARGHVTGTSSINDVDNRRHAFLYKSGRMRDLGSLDPGSDEGDFSTAYGLNMRDEVVGTTFRPSGGGALEQVAFVWQHGTMSDLEALTDSSGAGYRLMIATAVNNAGEITVRAMKGSETHAVLLIPSH